MPREPDLSTAGGTNVTESAAPAAAELILWKAIYLATSGFPQM